MGQPPGWSGPSSSRCWPARVLVQVERRVADPLVPLLHYLRQRNFAFPIGAQMFANFAYLGGFFLSPLSSKRSTAGASRPPASSSSPGPSPSPWWPRSPATWPSASASARPPSPAPSAWWPSMGVFALTGNHTGIALVEVALVLSGIGLGVASPSISSSMANVFDQTALGTAAATQQLMTQISTVAGIQVIQTVQSSEAHGLHGAALLPSFHAAFLVGGMVALGGLVCAVFRPFGRPPRGGRPPLNTAAAERPSLGHRRPRGPRHRRHR